MEALNNIILANALSPLDAHYLVTKFGFRREAFPIFFQGNLMKARVAIFSYNPWTEPLIDEFETALINHAMAMNPDFAMCPDINQGFRLAINDLYNIYFDEKIMHEKVGQFLSGGYWNELRATMINNSLFKDATKVYHSPFTFMYLLPFRSPKLYLKLFEDPMIKDVVHKSWAYNVMNLLAAENLKMIHFSGKEVFKKALQQNNDVIIPGDLVEITTVNGNGKVMSGELLLHKPPDAPCDIVGIDRNTLPESKKVPFVLTNQITSKIGPDVLKEMRDVTGPLGIVLTLH